MFTLFLRPAAAALLALSLVLPASTPAMADAHRRGPSPEAVATVLGGLALIYLLKERRDDRREDRARDRERERERERARARAAKPKPKASPTPRRAVKIAPERCRREVIARNGSVRVGYGARCMQNRVARPGTLPPNCLRQERGRDGRHYYGRRCLRNEGWQVARR